jgi:SAM-dependent methyltransferase
VFGIDPYIEADIDYENGFSIKKCLISDMHNEMARFDLIMFNHSFEHMPHPDEVLNAAAAVLSDSGTIMIRIPTVDSHAWDHYRENWVQLDAPRHLYIHSRASLDILAAQAGLAITEVIYDSYSFQFWGSEQYIRDVPLESEQSFKNAGIHSSQFTQQQISEFERKAEELNKINLGDMAAYYLKKLPCNEQLTTEHSERHSCGKSL